MESLSNTIWDVVISGTGLPQSLLALALSRSGKKVLHIDQNDYYGGPDAALSLQEVASWANTTNEGSVPSPFRFATVRNVEAESNPASQEDNPPRLGFSRAYSLSLSPQLIYTRSNLLPALVSSKVYRQLEFLAVGSWWTYGKDDIMLNSEEENALDEAAAGSLKKIPGGREDVFADKSIDLRSTRSLMKFLKLAANTEAHALILAEWADKPFQDFLTSHLGIPLRLQAPLLALSLSPHVPDKTLTLHALPRIHRHLTSIGVFGPGFGSVIPKWGGQAEIAQVACRACAVGGGVYVLKKGLETVERQDQQRSDQNGTTLDDPTQLCTVRLEGGEEIQTRWIAGSAWDLPFQIESNSPLHESVPNYLARSITIVASSLGKLFPPPAEGAHPPAGAVVVFPTGTLDLEPEVRKPQISSTDLPPVYLAIHSSETGECPAGQCIIYAHTTYPSSRTTAHSLLSSAVDKLLASIHEDPKPAVLWNLHYEQEHTPPAATNDHDANIKTSNPHVLQLPNAEPGLALENEVLEHVKAAWQRIVGAGEGGFMVFGEREGMGMGDDEEGE